MLALIGKLLQLGQLLLGQFAGTLSKGKVCLLAGNHHWFIGCEMESACIRARLPRFVELYVSRLLNEKSDLTGSVELLVDAQVYRTI